MIKDLRVITPSAYTLTDSYVHGPKRLCQRVIIELLTEAGSMLYLKRRGCDFLTRIRKMALTEFDVIIAFATAKSQIRRNLRAEEEETRPPATEQYGGCELVQITIDTNLLYLDLNVKNRAGNTVMVRTPPIQL